MGTTGTKQRHHRSLMTGRGSRWSLQGLESRREGLSVDRKEKHTWDDCVRMCWKEMHAQEELHRPAHAIYRKNNENNFSLSSGQKCEIIEKNRDKRG